MRRLCYLLFAIALGASSTGCVTPPNFCDPGTTAYQQRKAQRFDPYPDPDIAQPIEGGRPREYQNPVPETERARWFHW